MNKHLYRIVFNKARSLLMVVAENVTSNDKAPGCSSGQGKRGGSTCVVRLRPLRFSLMAALGLVTLIAPLAQADIIADRNAPGNQRPTVLDTGNGTPLVNIQTPSAAGVSRNLYNQFDVDGRGAILNNSRGNVQTQLGGWVEGNPWLAKGGARVILNEVNSSNPSRLNGYIEVAGQRAELVIANPAGIACDGCGFINANRTTLTTGQPLLNGGRLDGYLVQDGRVVIEGAGLDASRSDFTAIIARSVEVNAGIWANDLAVVAGANRVSADQQQISAAPGKGVAAGVAIDVAQLGGMYAGKITLVGNEAGVGVRNAGQIGASAGEVVISADGRLENFGSIASATAVRTRVGGDLVNSAGRVQALGDIQVTTGGQVDNRAGLLRAGQTLRLTAESLDNSATQNVEQGIEGYSLAITAKRIDNTAGAMRADGDLKLSSDDRLDNTLGQIAVGRDLDITATEPTGAGPSIENADGTLIAGRALAIKANLYSGDGQALSLGDLSLQLNGDYQHSGLLQAGGDLKLKLAGSLSNHGELLAGNRLDLQAAGLVNQTRGEIAAGHGHIRVDGELSNRGLIDGEQIEMRATHLANLGAGRIYGDTLNIEVDSLRNDVEQGEAGVIAARERMDIGAREILNREQALIFSAGDLAIGGRLDADGRASGQTDTLNNASATIEALGDLALNVRRVRNSNEHFSTEEVEVSRQAVREFQLSGSPNRYGSDQVSTYTDEVLYLVTPAGRRDNWNRYDYTRVVNETRIKTSAPGQILAGGNLAIDAEEVVNDKSRIIAGGLLQANIDSLTNTEVAGQRVTSDSGTVTNFYRIQRKGRDRQGSRSSAYRPASSIQEISLQPSVYEQHSTPNGSGLGLGPVISVPLLDQQNASGIVQQVRNASLVLQVPSGALFRPSSSASYLVETDPRFASYRNWLSSDYMLQRLSVDPARTQKRLGDGFYEQKLIREQVAQLTGRRFLDGHADDEAQYLALIDSAITLADAWQLVPGVALSAEQMAQLTSDIVWLVEREVALADGSTTLALVPQVYVRVREGDLDGHGALLAGQILQLDISGDLVNSGSLGARGVAAISAENIENLGGRIQASAVDLHARSDLNNLGGLISAGDNLSVTAGRDLNLIANRQTTQSEQGRREMVSRIAGLFVSEPAGQLLAAAGRDLRLQAAQVVNSGEGGQTLLAAARDVDLGTVQESHSQVITWDSANWRKESISREVGSSIRTQGDLQLKAGNDLKMRASNVGAGGALLADAARDIQLSAGSQTRNVDEAHKSVGRSGISAKTTTSRDSVSDDQALSSSLSGVQTVLQARRDIGSEGAQLLGSDDLLLVAGRNINLLAATSSGSQASSKSRKSLTSADSRSSQSSWQSPEGSSLQGDDIELHAGQDIQLQGAAVRAEGAALLSAGRDIDIGSAIHSQSSSSARQSSRVGFAHHALLTNEQKAQQGQQSQHEAVGSVLSADSLHLDSGRDTRIAGSQLVTDGNIDINAGRDLLIVSSESQASHSSHTSSRKSGEIGEWWQPAMGSVKQSEKTQGETTRQVGSQIASLEGDISLRAGEAYRQTASQVLALQGDIDIEARQVTIEAGHDSLRHKQTQSTGRTALGGSVTVPLVDAVRGMQQIGKAASHTDDSRLQALAAATVGMQAYGAFNSGVALMDGNLSGIKISANLSNSQSSSTTAQSGRNVVGSGVIAGGDLNISARGDDNSDLKVLGSQLSAGSDLSLHADGEINLLAAQNTAEQHSKNAGSGWSVGVGFALGGSQNGFTLELAANKARGKADGEDLTHSNTYVTAGNTLSLTSGGDTNLKGAVVSGKKVVADIGGDLNLESLQDSSSYKSKQSSAGVGLSLCIPPFCVGMSSASGSLSNNSVQAGYASVNEYTGIQAGDGGFQLKVAGNTDLKGAVIASDQQAVDLQLNRLETGTLSASDIDNYSRYKAGATSVSGGVSFGIGEANKEFVAEHNNGKKQSTNLGGVGNSELAGTDHSTTRSGISAGTIIINDLQAQQERTGKSAEEVLAVLDRDVRAGDAANSLSKEWDGAELAKQVQANAEIAVAFSQQAGATIRGYAAQKRKSIRQQIEKTEDPATKESLQQEISALNTQERLLNVLVGALTGTLDTSVAQAVLSETADRMREYSIADSEKFPGVVDEEGNYVLTNMSGESAGIRGDGKKIAGTRVVLDIICGKSNERCITQKNADGSPVLDEKGMPRLKLAQDGMVKFNRGSVDGSSLENFLTTHPEGQKMAGLTGGVQGGQGTLNGSPYPVGGLLDHIHESFAGSHDFISGTLSGYYSVQGNAREGLSESQKIVYEVWAGLALLPATPFALSEALPAEAWQALSILMK